MISSDYIIKIALTIQQISTMPTRRQADSFNKNHHPSQLDNIRVILVRPFHPGNIGSVARAMKTMGLTDLCLVAPKDFPSAEANKMAMSAIDVVENAMLVNDLPSAIADCQVVIASTARIRGIDLPELSPEQTAEKLIATVEEKMDANVAIVLGPERMGLHNDDIQHATHRVTIPTSPQMQSLNIAAAAQTLCYEVYKRHIQNELPIRNHNPSAGVLKQTKARKNLSTREDHERFYIHLEKTINSTGFIKQGHGGPIMQRLRALFSRAEPDKDELNILRAILASVEKSLNKTD